MLILFFFPLSKTFIFVFAVKNMFNLVELYFLKILNNQI